jgi:hypothetical protein
VAKDFWGVLSGIGLICLIAGDVALLTILALCHQWAWLIVFSCITVIIGVAEIYCYLRYGKTISTMYKEWIKSEKGKKWSWAYTALGCFTFAMAGLIVHLAVYAGMFKKEEAK